MQTLKVIVTALVMVMAATRVHAQQAGSASIRGIVVDQQNAVLPGVTVLATHQESGVFRQTVSGEDGTYILVGLVPGPYVVTAELSGFKKLTQPNVLLAIGTTLTLELKLDVGDLVESVTVTGDTPLVDFTSAQVRGNVSSGELKDLPSTSRDFVGFVSMLPGVQ